jgi:hypothetical protein
MCSNPLNPLPSQAIVEESSEAIIQTARLRDGYLTTAQRRTEQILAPTGPFKPLLEKYMATVAPNRYKAVDLVKVRGDIGKFLRFVVQDLRIVDLDQIRPSTITRYIERQRANGLTSHNFLGHLASFFVWLISQELYDRGNPVINNLHRGQMHSELDSSASTQ